nr:MAG TPA: hypothetical protein [Caudoviricetes sp.]DAX58984.1 MAG TPA: hypothetical protein [Caudoviricetes sp.]
MFPPCDYIISQKYRVVNISLRKGLDKYHVVI